MFECIFCKIVRGELPKYKIYEDDNALAFLDIHPVSPGHTLVIPKEHAGNIFEISPEHWGFVQEAVRKVAIALENTMEANGVNLMMNNREHAGQVVDHAHVHVIPRFKGDNLKLWPHKDYEDQVAEKIATKVRSQFE